MTPRTIDPKEDLNLIQTLSEKLLLERREPPSTFSLTYQSPLFDILHPALMKLTLQFEKDPLSLNIRQESHGLWLWAFKNAIEAKKVLGQEISLIYGQPCEVWKYLESKPDKVFFDFGPLGAVLLTNEKPAEVKLPELHHILMPAWIDYALSPELWGSEGKWTRFHQRLHTIFERFDLLMGEDFPGFYPLKKNFKQIETLGFKGDDKEESYNLTLPWTFPLSGLEKLEKVLIQEF